MTDEDEEADSLMQNAAHGNVDGLDQATAAGGAATAARTAGGTREAPNPPRQTPLPQSRCRACLRRLDCSSWTSRQRHRALSALYIAGLAVIGIVYATAGEGWATIVMAVVFTAAIIVQTIVLVVRFCGSQQLREMRAALRQRALEAAVERAALEGGLGDGRGPRRGRGGRGGAAGMRVVRVPLEHLHLMLRELSAEDYEALLALDGGPDDPSAALQAAGEDEIRRLPTFAYRKRGNASASASVSGSAAPAAACAAAAASDADAAVSCAADSLSGTSDAAARAAPSSKAAVAAATSSEGGTADSAATTCSICLENFENDESLRMLPCMHAFHTPCIDTWLGQKASCPVCKISIRDPVFESV